MTRELSHPPAYHRTMLEPLPVRIYAARRAAVESNLTGSGMPDDDAERWLARLGVSCGRGLDRDDRDYWTRGSAWIELRRRRGTQGQPVV
jgi:hypothetical protein